MSGFRVVIPARYGSSRLPGKPLVDLGGQPMVEHVWRRALEAGADEVVIATDDVRVQQAVRGFGAEALMTRDDHESGSERLAEVVETLGWSEDTPVVNLQGDEPFMPAALIRQVAEDLVNHPVAPMTTLCHPVSGPREIFDPNAVKVVLDGEGYALYFSRAPIPWDRDCFPLEVDDEAPEGYLRHIGLYAYRAGFLKRYVRWPASPLEQVERLEQLRVLWHGERLHVVVTHLDPGLGIDTEQDLAQARGRLGKVVR